MLTLRTMLLPLLALAGLWAGAGTWTGSERCPEEHPVMPIPLLDGLERSEAEISGLAWHGDALVVLPQYPERLGGNLFALSRADLERWVRDGGRGKAPRPRPVPFGVGDLAERIDGFEGFEAIAFHGRDVFVTVEGETDRARGYLLRGRVVGDLERIDLDTSRMAVLDPQTGLENLAYEALVVTGDRVMVFYEANGANNPRPRVSVFDTDLEPAGDLALGHLEYRITDVTAVGPDGSLWATNFYWPGADWRPGNCPLASRFGLGTTHSRSDTVERLVELRVTDDGIRPTGAAPVQLELEAARSRNWEGIARLGDAGFLVVTDEHPRSMLGFVAR